MEINNENECYICDKSHELSNEIIEFLLKKKPTLSLDSCVISLILSLAKISWHSGKEGTGKAMRLKNVQEILDIAYENLKTCNKESQ